MASANHNTTLGIIIGNRDRFPDQLATEGRKDILSVLREAGIEAVILDESATNRGAVETWMEAKKCAALFQDHADRIDGLLVVLPNFGDEKGIADTVKLSGLQVPILVQAYPDDLGSLGVDRRRDAFCGKISVCNNLKQYGYPFSLTRSHTVSPASDEFKADLARFAGVCRVVKGLRNARIGAIGARPSAFNTMRFSEKLLQAYGISVTTVDLSEIFSAASQLSDTDARVKARTAELEGEFAIGSVPAPSLLKIAKLALVVDDWMEANDLQAMAMQCWTSIQQNYGVNACAVMSMLSQQLKPAACELDVPGAISMYALQLASGAPSALVDWNNNYADDPDKCVLFHCGNWPKAFFPQAQLEYDYILAGPLGKESTYGTVTGRAAAGPMTFTRISTDDYNGIIRSYVGEGSLTDDPLATFGSRAVLQVSGLPSLLQYICRQGFEHHVAMSASRSADIIAEAFETYLGWEVHRHNG